MKRVSEDIGKDVDTGKKLRPTIFAQLGGKKLRQSVDVLRKPDDQRADKLLEDVVRIIHNYELVREHGLYFPDVVELAKRANHLFIKKGEPLFRATDPCNRTYFLMYGSLIVTLPVLQNKDAGLHRILTRRNNEKKTFIT